MLDYINFFSGGYQTQIRNALHARAQELGIDLLLYFGRALKEPNAHSAAHNQIFRLVHPDTLDGIIVLSTCLAGYCGAEGIAEFLRECPRMPVCSIGVAVPGVPSILVDNRNGMAAVVEHMIQSHGRRRVAFITGDPANPEAETRFAAYQAVLEQHGIATDPALLATGHFSRQGGRAAMEEILARGVPLDAVVAANDHMALGAIEALHARGKQVPRDLPVTGFDDLVLARLGNPPLTTVRQPFEVMAETAFRMLLEQLAERSVPEPSLLPTEFIMRHSCGCNRPSIPTLRPNDAKSTLGVREHLRENSARITRVLSHCMQMEGRDDSADAARLLAALALELNGHSGSFLRVVNELLHNTREDDENHRVLHNGVTYLRGEFHSFSSPKLEELWYEASSSINLASTTAQALHRIQIDDNYLHLITAGEQASIALDWPSLRSVLERNLPEMGVPTAFVSRYPGGVPSELEPFVCVLDGVAQPVETTRFPAHHLVPRGFGRRANPSTWLVFPLAFEAQCLGVAVFEYQSSTNGYHVIRDQISAAFRSVELHHEVVEKTMLHERSVQERLATAGRMQSLSVLAGGVAHDLNNALGPLVALPDIILCEITAWSLPETMVADVRADIESIKAASLRAAQTIKDLLTLGRQGQIAKEPLNLNRLVADCLTDGSVRFMQDQRHRVRVSLDLTPETVTIRGSEPHLVRAITNLVKNAVEATSGDGKVVVGTRPTHVAEPLAGYETVDPGDYVVLSVRDDGRGIPKAELGRVFEPFFSKKRPTEDSGTGLGLAIVHGVVKDHQGFVDVVSTERSGTTFLVYFPRVLERVNSCKPTLMTSAGRARVLMVDDEPVQLRTGRRVLTHLGYDVDTLESGQLAYSLFLDASVSGKSPYDLVILDMILNEDRDGLEIFEQIRQWFPAQRAIVVSGHAPSERAELAVNRGLAWLVKPYTADALAQAVQAALYDGPRQEGPTAAARRHSAPSTAPPAR